MELIDAMSAVGLEIADGTCLALILIKVAQIPSGDHQAGVRFGALASNTVGRCFNDIVEVSRAGIIPFNLLIVHHLEAACVHAVQHIVLICDWSHFSVWFRCSTHGATTMRRRNTCVSQSAS